MELYGKKTRCVYCGRSDSKDFKLIIMKTRGKEDTAFVCSRECEDAALDCCRFIERGFPFFISGIIISILLGVFAGALSSFFKTSSVCLSNIGILIAGVTVASFPFVTPETTKLFGIKNGMLLGRISGIVILVFGMIMMLKK